MSPPPSTPGPWRFRLPARATQSSQTPHAPIQFQSTPRFSSSSVTRSAVKRADQDNEDIEEVDSDDEGVGSAQEGEGEREHVGDKRHASLDDSIESASDIAAVSSQHDGDHKPDDAASISEIDASSDLDPWQETPVPDRHDSKRRKLASSPSLGSSSPLRGNRDMNSAHSHDGDLASDDYDYPERIALNAESPTSLQQPVFQQPPRFKPLDAELDSEGLPMAFSPQRRGAKYVSEGMAAELQGWLSDLKGWEGPERSSPESTLRMVVERVRPGRRMYLAHGRLDNEPELKGFILAGEGRLTGLGKRADVEAGSAVLLGRPVWDVELENQVWTVACDWTVD